jgi:thiamine biosynthesis lipoprotein ApbE
MPVEPLFREVHVEWVMGTVVSLDIRSGPSDPAVLDAAIATSGAYERGQHIIDPRTARRPKACCR